MNQYQEQVKKIKKIAIYSIGGLIAAILALNSFTIVNDGTVKTQTFLGKVDPKPVLPGFNIVNPFASFDTFNTKDIALKFKKMQVPSQDKQKSNVDITVMLQFDGAKAPINRVNAGSQEEALDRYVTEKLRSTILEFGKAVPLAQDLFRADIQSRLQEEIKTEVESYARVYGYTVKQVFLQDIDLPPVVKTQVENTKVREEQVNAAKADTARVEIEAQQKVKQAEADREARENMAKANERDADATLYSAKKVAEANAALQRTVTPEMIKWKQLDVDMIRAKAYKGGVPHTVMGAGYEGQVIFDSRNN